jgi:predicted GNAT family acetyltransferase
MVYGPSDQGANVDHQIVDNPQARRFEIYADGDLAGFAEYHLYRDEIAFLHTEIANRFRGRGLGVELAHHALDDARKRGSAVLPYCPFIRRWITQHPDYLDLVPEVQRGRFNL